MADNDLLIQSVPDKGAILNGQWRLLTSTARDEIRRIRRDPEAMAQARTRRERAQGLANKLARGTPFVNGQVDGHPAKVLTWPDATGQMHTCVLVALDEPLAAGTAGQAPASAGRTRLVRIIHDTQGNVSYAYEIFEAIELPVGLVTFGSALLALFTKHMVNIGTRMRDAVTAAVELTDLAAAGNRIAQAARQEPVIVGGQVARLLSGGRVLSRVFTGVGVVGALVGLADLVYRKLLAPMTVSIELSNLTDDDLEWTISELDETSVWLNRPEDPRVGSWATLPGIERSGHPLPGVDGSYDSFASVEIGIANTGSIVSTNTTRLCLSVRRKHGDAPPFVFMLSMPPGSDNTMAIETGAAGPGFFDGHKGSLQDALSVRRDVVIDGLPVSLEAITDRNSGETSYAELRGRNYTVGLVVAARRYRMLTADGRMALVPSQDGVHVVLRAVDMAATDQEWMLMDRGGVGVEIIHRQTRKALTASISGDGGRRLSLEARRATATGQPRSEPMAPGEALDWLGQAFLVRDLFGDPTPILSLVGPVAVDVQGGSNDAGTPVILWPAHLGPNQMFRFDEIV